MEQLIRHFLARSDVEAALKVIETAEDKRMLDYITTYWPSLMLGEAEYAKVYEVAGQIEAQQQGVFQAVAQSPRYQAVARWFSKRPRQLRVLDWGCSRGYWAIHLANAFDHTFQLVDIDQLSVAEAKRAIELHAKDTRSFLEPFIGTETIGQGYDVAMLLDVLEHVRNPAEVLAKINAIAKEVLITVPFGPHEYQMWIRSPERLREHVREYTYEDLGEIFAGFPDFKVEPLWYGPDPILGEPLGHFLVSYTTAPGFVTSSINWSRKLALKPRKLFALPF